MYKWKAQKIRPVDSSFLDGMNTGKSVWKDEILEGEQKGRRNEQGPCGRWLIPEFSTLAKGTRLTDKRVAIMQIGTDILPQEEDLLMQLLYNREAVLSWDFSEIGKVRSAVAAPQQSRASPHTAWQAPGFPIPRALDGIVVEMLKDRISSGLLEPYHGPYRKP
jgi:hypothetical protein